MTHTDTSAGATKLPLFADFFISTMEVRPSHLFSNSYNILPKLLKALSRAWPSPALALDSLSKGQLAGAWPELVGLRVPS